MHKCRRVFELISAVFSSSPLLSSNIKYNCCIVNLSTMIPNKNMKNKQNQNFLLDSKKNYFKNWVFTIYSTTAYCWLPCEFDKKFKYLNCYLIGFGNIWKYILLLLISILQTQRGDEVWKQFLVEERKLQKLMGDVGIFVSLGEYLAVEWEICWWESFMGIYILDLLIKINFHP